MDYFIIRNIREKKIPRLLTENREIFLFFYDFYVFLRFRGI